MQGLPEYRSVLHNPRAPEELVCPGMRSRLLHPRQEAAPGGLPCRVQVPLSKHGPDTSMTTCEWESYVPQALMEFDLQERGLGGGIPEEKSDDARTTSQRATSLSATSLP